ncbi:hypothetical protein HDU99_009921 [Rhizoclosmatium hyalinum]|nr:hypothetical protein HDU99_009921 [Rhizoclosmatium hyalinum]
MSPRVAPQRTAWACCILITFVGTSLLMTWCYGRTYYLSAKQFRENPMMLSYFMKVGEESQDPETLGLIRIRLERKILFKCILLSMSLVLCYLPIFVYSMLLWYYNFPLRPSFDVEGQFYMGGAICLAVNMIVSPILVLYFNADLRDVVYFWK